MLNKLLMTTAASILTGSYAEAGCRNDIVKVVDIGAHVRQGLDVTDEASFLKSPREITMIMQCHGDRVLNPETTVFSLLEEKEGKTCMRDFSCGNVDAYQVGFAISGSVYWFDSDTYVTGAGFINRQKGYQSWYDIDTRYDGGGVNAYIGVDWGKISRSCSEPKEEVCI